MNNNSNETLRPSTVLSMTLPMFNTIDIKGIENIKAMNRIIDNLETLHKALIRIEKEIEDNETNNK